MIIGFMGYKGSGKDTAANSLVFRANFKKVNFADALRDVVCRVFPVNREQVTDSILKETQLEQWPFQSPRRLLQDVGMMFRENYPGVWIRAWEERMLLLPNVVCADVRFEDEVRAIRKYNGVLVHINRPAIDGTQDTHCSEHSLGEVQPDYTIENNSDNVVAFENKVFQTLIPIIHSHKIWE